MKLEFDSDKGYRSGVYGRKLDKEDYLSLPIVKWCNDKIGEINWPKDVNEVLTGDGWDIYSDWVERLSDNTLDFAPRLYVIINKEIDQRLVTEFWIRFGK